MESSTIEQIQNGNKEAFKELYGEYKEKVYKTVCMMINDASAAEDLVQEIFINIYLKIYKLNYYEALNSWIYKITVNSCMRYLKKNSKFKYEDDENAINCIIENNPSVLPEERLMIRELNKEVMKVIYELSDSQKICIILFYYNRMSIKEIAAVMECSENTIKSRLFKGKKYLENKLKNAQEIMKGVEVSGYR